jgi:receptor protein-tyrosine kinase
MREVELRDYLNMIRARKWVIIQAVVVVTLVALVGSLLLPKTYQGEAKVLISETDTGAALFGSLLPGLSSQPERLLQTEVQLMQLRPLAEQVVRDPKLNLKTTPADLLDRTTITASGQTDVVIINVTASDPKAAADITNAMATAYVQWSMATKRESIRNAANEVQSELDVAKQQVLDLGRRIQSEGKSDELSAELQIATGSYTTLAQKLQELRVDEQLETGSGRVVSTAVVDPTPVSPKVARNTALGLAIGLVFGIGMAFLYEYLDNTIKSTEEAEKLYGAPVLGHIPFEKFEKGEKRRLTIAQHPGSPAAESYRVLRNSLDFINFEHDIKTLVVSSAAPGEGKSTVAANLAAGLAQAGQKVVLVSCDFRRPTTETFFGVTNMIGLSEVLTGADSLKSALQRPGEEQLLVLTSGKMPPNPSELLGSQKMKELIESLEEWGDWVIIDTPPLLAVADPAAVARWADGVLVVTRGGQSTRDAAKKAREMLEKVGAKIIGTVVWGLEEGPGGRGYGYYGYGYGYGGYYYYSDYYNAGQGRGGKKHASDSGAQAPLSVQAGEDAGAYTPAKSGGRRAAEFVGRVMAGVLVFLLVLIVVAVVVYFLDRSLGWGLMATLQGLLSLR